MDVMLSVPPARAPAPLVSSNYKGVLLCERPKGGGSCPTSSIPFSSAISGVSGDTLGMGPSVEQRKLAEERKQGGCKKKSDTVLTKHSKWLREQQRKRDEQAIRDMENDLDTDIADEKFRAEQAKMRKMLLKQRDAASSKAPPSLLSDTASNSSSGPRRTPPRHTTPPRTGSGGAFSHPFRNPNVLQSVPGGAKGGVCGNLRKKEKKMPKWALTEEEAENAELAEGLKLAGFAEALNFDEFLQEQEVKEALAVIKSKLDEVSSDGTDESDEERQRVMEEIDLMSDVGSQHSGFPNIKDRKVRISSSHGHPPPTPALSTVSHDTEWNLNTKHQNIINAESLQLAESILSKNERLRQVHTKISLAKILQQLTRRSLKQSQGDNA